MFDINTLKFDEIAASDIFNDLYNTIWNSEEFLDFLKENKNLVRPDAVIYGYFRGGSSVQNASEVMKEIYKSAK